MFLGEPLKSLWRLIINSIKKNMFYWQHLEWQDSFIWKSSYDIYRKTTHFVFNIFQNLLDAFYLIRRFDLNICLIVIGNIITQFLLWTYCTLGWCFSSCDILLVAPNYYKNHHTKFKMPKSTLKAIPYSSI